IADRAAALLFWFALGAALITAVVWTLFGLPDDAVIRTITVLVIACPHALGLAIPLVVSIATERAARGGGRVTARRARQPVRQGGAGLCGQPAPLPGGEPAVTGAEPPRDRRAAELLPLAAAREADREHPLAGSIVAAAKEKRPALEP